MDDVQREKSPATAEIASDANTQDRHQQLERLYHSNYDFLINTALADRTLFVADAERIITGLARHLPDYAGPIIPESFREWAAEIIGPAASRLANFYRLKTDTAKDVEKGINSVLASASDFMDDFTLQDITDSVWIKAFKKLDALLTPGTATLGTRMYALAAWEARAWKTARLRAREKFTSLKELEPTKRREAIEV